MPELKNTSNKRKWWQNNNSPIDLHRSNLVGQPCPKCLLADLDYDTLFRLSCPVCGFIAECGAFT